MKILHTADWHIGTSRIYPQTIYNNLKEFLFPYLNDELDMFILAGDFTDKGISYDSNASHIATEIIIDMVLLSKKHNFDIVVLDGTFSHDKYNNKMFLTIAKQLNAEENVYLFDEMKIKYFDKYDKYFMFVPDDLPSTNLEKDIIKLIKTLPDKQVDYLIFHGMVNHVLPHMPHKPPNTINADILLPYIKYYAMSGHIHQTSIYKNKWYMAGSFERDVHGDFTKKGFFYFDTDKKNIKFIENKNATIFETIDLKKYKLDDITIVTNIISDKLDNILNNKNHINNKKHIRFLTSHNIIKLAIQQWIIENYSFKNLYFKYESKEDRDRIEDIIDEEEEKEETIIINEKTFPSIIKEEINNILSIEEIKEILTYGT